MARKTNGTDLDLYRSTTGLRGRREIRLDTDDLIDALAAELTDAAVKRAAESGAFHLALSGGTTPQKLYQRLMIDPRFRLLPWRSTHVWQVDDRCVPTDDERSNQRMLHEWLFDHSGIPPRQMHYMPVLEAEGDARYEAAMRDAIENPQTNGRLDFVLLGMGDDGHTASLFPNSPALGEREKWIVFNDGPTVTEPRPRMTMTYPLINGARRIAVLVTGAGKHAMLSTVAQEAEAGGDTAALPVLGVEPVHEDATLTWYLDGAAATGGEAG